MNVPSTFELAITQDHFDRAIRDVNEWRGRCLHLFAEAELGASQCLQAMSRSPDGGKIRQRHLIGQRFDDLEQALSSRGPFAGEGKKVLPALREFRELDALRPTLCHGASEVTLDKLGRWTAVFRHFDFRSRESGEVVRVVKENEAAGLQKDLSHKGKRLCSQLSTLIASLK